MCVNLFAFRELSPRAALCDLKFLTLFDIKHFAMKEYQCSKSATRGTCISPCYANIIFYISMYYLEKQNRGRNAKLLLDTNFQITGTLSLSNYFGTNTYIQRTIVCLIYRSITLRF